MAYVVPAGRATTNDYDLILLSNRRRHCLRRDAIAHCCRHESRGDMTLRAHFCTVECNKKTCDGLSSRSQSNNNGFTQIHTRFNGQTLAIQLRVQEKIDYLFHSLCAATRSAAAASTNQSQRTSAPSWEAPAPAARAARTEAAGAPRLTLAMRKIEAAAAVAAERNAKDAQNSTRSARRHQHVFACAKMTTKMMQTKMGAIRLWIRS